jgi:hypothetical protein
MHAFFWQRSQPNANLNFFNPYGTLHTRGLALMLCLLLWYYEKLTSREPFGTLSDTGG